MLAQNLFMLGRLKGAKYNPHAGQIRDIAILANWLKDYFILINNSSQLLLLNYLIELRIQAL